MRTEGRALPPVTPFSDSLTAPIRPPPPKEHEGSHGERRLEASHANPSSEESPHLAPEGGWSPGVACSPGPEVGDSGVRWGVNTRQADRLHWEGGWQSLGPLEGPVENKPVPQHIPAQHVARWPW